VEFTETFDYSGEKASHLVPLDDAIKALE